MLSVWSSPFVVPLPDLPVFVFFPLILASPFSFRLSPRRYYHRSLNPKKLIEVGFSRLQPRMTMARTIKLYRPHEVRSVRLCARSSAI